MNVQSPYKKWWSTLKAHYTISSAHCQCEIIIAKDWWINFIQSSGKLWCHCAQCDLARHPKQASAWRSCHTWLQGFSIMYVKDTLNPTESHRLPAQMKLFKLTSIPRMQYTWNLYWCIEIQESLQLMIDEFYTMLEEILLLQHECFIMGDFNLLNKYWTLQRPTPAQGNKLEH